jgi:hypothetical protein
LESALALTGEQPSVDNTAAIEGSADMNGLAAGGQDRSKMMWWTAPAPGNELP